MAPAVVLERRALTAGLCSLAFCTMFSYAIASSAAQSLYLSAFGAGQLPWVWMGVALASVVVTTWLNGLARRTDIVRLFAIGAKASNISLLALLILAHVFPRPGAFLLYVWKDIYIIVLVELFWTFANVVFGVHAATKNYGLFCAAGSLGSVIGNLMLGASAHHIGTQHALWTLIPLLWAIGWGCLRLAHNVPVPKPTPRAHSGLWHALTTLRKSALLPWLLVVVALVQAYLTFLDFRFSLAIEQTARTEAEQTQIIGNMYAALNALSFVLQLGTSFLLGSFGLAKTLAALPLLSMGALGAVIVRPQMLGAVCVAQLLTKALDYSLFRAAKEMLYIPLSYAEKTQGKAIVDILTYRVAKGAVSMVLLTLAGAQQLVLLLNGIMATLVVLWAVGVAVLLRRFRRLIEDRAHS